MSTAGHDGRMSEDYLLPVTTATRERDRAPELALLPIGSFEQHGDFLPLTTDTIIAVTDRKSVV